MILSLVQTTDSDSRAWIVDGSMHSQSLLEEMLDQGASDVAGGATHKNGDARIYENYFAVRHDGEWLR